MAGAGLGPGGQMLVGVQRHHPERPVGHRHVEVLTVPGALAAQQGGHHRQRSMHAARGDVGDGGTGQSRGAAGATAAAMHVSRHGQVVQIVSGPVPTGTILTVAAGRAVDDPLVDRPDSLVPDAEAVGHAGAEALHHHIGTASQGQQSVAPLVALQVEQGAAHAAAAAVGVGGRHHSHIRVPGHRTDLDHVRAVVGQQAGGSRRRPYWSQIEHPDSFQGARRGAVRGPGSHGRYWGDGGGERLSGCSQRAWES